MNSPNFNRNATAAVLVLVAFAAVGLVWLRQPAADAPPPAVSAPTRAVMLTGLIDTSLQRVSNMQQSPSSAPPAQPVLAVMPFDAPADDGTLSAVADALCDAVLDRLQRDNGPTACACNSARIAAQVGMSPAEVGRLLGVRWLLTGTLSREGQQLRLRARLTATADGQELWTHDALFAPDRLQQLPQQLAQRVVGRAPAVASEAPTSVHSPPGPAYAQYLQALRLRRIGGRENLLEARRQLDEALALAPNYPPAIVASIGLNSNLLALGVGSGAAVDAQVRQAALHLRRVDPDGPQAALVGSSAAVGQRRWTEALQLLQHGAANHPQNATLLHTKAGILMMMGYLKQGQTVAHQVALLEPLNPSSHERLARAWSLLGDDARLHESAVLARELGWGPQAAGFFGQHSLRQRNAADAERHWAEGLAAAQLPTEWLGPVLRAHLDPTVRVSAVAAVDAVPDAARKAMNHLFLAYALAGDVERTLGALARTREEVPTMWVTDLWLPEMAAVRRDPRFVEYARELGLTSLWEAHGEPDLCSLVNDKEWRCH
ncbi:MAG TPA: hypothetical protein VMK82_05890 [Steroidobacteraceae bacterium]|nr:hypothetical protein [Steroidobacteraceae bacterium]